MSHRRYTIGTMIDVFEVRFELYALRNQLLEWVNEHLSDRAKAEGPAVHSCPVCKMWRDRIGGVDMAIRRFGGRPRR